MIKNEKEKSMKKQLRESTEAEQWWASKENNDPLAKAAFVAAFDLINANFKSTTDVETDEEEDAIMAENSVNLQSILQGIYLALEEFTPSAEDLIDAKAIFSKEPLIIM